MNEVEDFLEHFGVKGMKWGVRKSDSSGGSSGSSKKIAKADNKWEKKTNKSYMKHYSAAAGKMNSTEIDRINNKPEYKDADFTKDSPLRKKYYQEYADTFGKAMRDSYASSGSLTNPSKTKEIHIEYDAEQDAMPRLYIREKNVSHAEGDVYINLTIDDKGRIMEFGSMDQLEHGVDDFLEHYGVKGMKWGVRRANRSGGSGGSGKPQKASLNARRKMNKVARKEDREAARQERRANDQSILKARKELSQKQAAYKDAKKLYKEQRTQIGRVAAKRVLKEPLNDLMKTSEKASEYTTSEIKKAAAMEVGIGVTRALLLGK